MANYELQGESEYMNWLTVSYNEDDDEDSYFEGWLSVVKRLNDSSNYSEAKITINTAKQPFWGKITNVTLTLNISEYSTGRFRIAGKVFDATIGNKSVDITEQYLAASGELNLWITGIPTTSADASIKFDTSGKNAPKLTFEYLKPHNYKSIELTDGVTAGLNFVEDKRVITITDCENTVGGMTVALSHVYNSNGGGGAPYGFCFNLNVCETYNGSTGVLVEANGDAYHRSGNLIKNYSVEGRATPVLIQKVPEATRLNNNNNINWLYADGVFKGYNVSDLKLAIICDITGNCILFKYNSDGSLYTVRYSKDGISTLLYEMQYSGGKLTHLIDKVRNDGILYTYSGTALSSIIKSGLTYSLTYGDDDDNVQLEDIKISNGYAIYSFPNSINVRSSVTKIPDGSATVGEKIASWDFERIANGTYQITDIDGNREQIKYAKDGYISEQLIEQNGVVVSAEQYSYKEQDYRNTYKASRSSLFKNKIENFRFTTGETTKTVLNGYNQPTKSTTTNITVTETSTANSVTDYTYNSNLQLIKEQTVVTYSTSGQSNVSYTYITEYDYSEDGKTVTKTSYVNGEQALNGKTIEKQVITDSAEGTRTVITKAYNSKAQTDIIYAEKKYNANGQQTSEYDGVDGRVSFTYNGKGEVGNVTYPNNSQVTYDYDAQSRVTTVSCADSFNGIMYLSGEVTAMNDGNSSIGLEYDGKRRISKAKVGGQEIESYTYSEGNEFNTDVKTVLLTYGNGTTVKSVAAKDGSFVKGYINGALKYTANYNKDGSVASETDSVTGEVTNYTYDESTGLLKKVETKKNGAVTQTAQYTYNRFGKLASGGNHTYIYEDNAEKRLYSDTLAGKGVTFYDYDLLGRVKYKSLLTLKGSTITNQTIAYKKNGEETNNRPAKITYEDGEDIKYEYDSNGRIHCVTKFGYDSDYYHYDSRGRLVREDNAWLGTTTLFEYDNYGNITRKCIADYTPDDDEDVHTVYNYTYANGRLKSYGGKNCEYDNIGNPTTYLGKSAEWKGKQLTSYAGTTFTYDGKGRRINKGNITFTYDCEGNLAQQSNGMSFFYDSQGVSGFAYGGNNYYYKKDALGDVIAILDATGATVASYEYNAWGEHSISGNTTIGNLNPFRYRSYYFDTETGLYYLQTRYYDPVTCRFLNMDSIKYAEPTSIGGLNLYAYCNNNPVMYTDPTGTFIGALVAGALIGGLGSGIFKAIGAAIKGESALSCFGSFVGGFITGAALGAATVLGGGLAVGAFATTAVTVAGMAAYLTVGTFAIGMWSYWLEGKIKGNQFDWDAAFINGGLTMAQGLMSFVIGAAMGYAGLYDSLKPGNGFGDILKATKQFELIEAGQVSKDILTNVFTTYMNENISAMSVRFLVKSIFVSPWNLVRP